MKIFTWRQRGIVLLVNAVVITIALAVGILLDRVTGKKPLFLFLTVIVSFPLGQYLLVKYLRKH